MKASALIGILLAAAAGVSCGTKHEAAGAGTGAGGEGGSSTSGSTASSSSGAGGGSVTGPTGGKLDTLSFAIVGDTRPTNVDDTPGYPTAIITKLWQQVEAQSPRPAFAVMTGDYQYADPYGSEGPIQVALYMQARAAFSNAAFPAMGNHECTGATASNCGTGTTDGITNNYTAYMQKMLGPVGVKSPYYTVDVTSTTGAWTAKFVVIAANAWSTAQSTWLDAQLAAQTTYTFVVRHESSDTTTTPGVTPSEAIIAKHPYTLKIVGHSHEYRYYSNTREVIVGNGGAPLSGGSNYGYVVARQRSDGAIVFTSYEYMTNAVVQTFALKADGTAAP